MTDVSILIFTITIAAAIPTAMIIGTVVYCIRENKKSEQSLKEHLIAMELFNREAERRSQRADERQVIWFKELGYRTDQIFERVDKPEHP